jgi:hypothetical protein
MSTLAVVLLAIPPVVLLILLPFYATLGATELAARAASWATEATGVFGLTGKVAAVALAVPKFLVMMFKNVRRNLVGTSLTYLATFAGVFVVAMIWSVLAFLDNVMTEKSKDVKVIVTEKFQIPSQMPPSYESALAADATDLPAGLAADPAKDLMSWTFVGAATDPNARTLESMVFFFALEPESLLTMMDDLDVNTIGRGDRDRLEANVREMKTNLRGVILGHERLKAINKQIGDRIKVHSFNYKDIDFEIEIIGTFPRGRYDMSSAMNISYFRRALDAYERTKGKRHPLADKSLNLYWARFPDKEGFERYAARVGQPGRFSSPAVKVEMSSAAVSSFLDAYTLRSALDRELTRLGRILDGADEQRAATNSPAPPTNPDNDNAQLVISIHAGPSAGIQVARVVVGILAPILSGLLLAGGATAPAVILPVVVLGIIFYTIWRDERHLRRQVQRR